MIRGRSAGRTLAAVWLALACLGAGSPADETVRAVHEVQPGESLWVIAANTIGDPTLWPALYRANRDQIKDPRLLYPGQRLAIPEVDPAQREEVRREAASLVGR